METPEHENRHSFPLSALFVLVATCAVIAALIAPVVRSVVDGSVGLTEAALASFIGTLSIMLLGGAIGLYHHRRARGFMWGLLTGAAIGVIAGPIVLAPVTAFPALMNMSAIGALILLAIGAGLRIAHRR